MPKRIGNIFDEAIKFEKFKAAFERTTTNKKTNPERIKFGMYLEDNIYKIGTQIKNKTYNVGKYNMFKVYIPKERIIYCLDFKDRVVHQWYVHEFILPYMVPKFIETSYACIKGRGVHKAINKVQQYMQIAKRKWKKPYILKYDIKKFFYSIDQKTLYEIIKKYYKDKDFLELTKKFIIFNPKKDIEETISNQSLPTKEIEETISNQSLSATKEIEETINNQSLSTKEIEKFKVGIPIGNYTSQFFANIYMNELDQYIKRKLKIKYYVRYMDDGIIILKDKETAKETLKKVRKFLKDNLKLELNKKTKYFPVECGVIFCGYRIYTTHKLLKRANIKRMKRRITKWNKKYEKADIDEIKRWKQSFMAWKGYAKEAEKHSLYKTLESKCKWIDNTR